jgi:hypothetical protein
VGAGPQPEDRRPELPALPPGDPPCPLTSPSSPTCTTPTSTRWHLYVFDRFGDLLALLRLPDEERRALIASMSTPAGDHGKPVPVREQARLLGIAVNTVQADREALGLRVVKDRPEPLPAPAGKVWQQAAEHLRRAGDRGLTLVELAAVAKWTEGKASGALTDVRRRGLAQRTEDRRAGQRVHLATEADQ